MDSLQSTYRRQFCNRPVSLSGSHRTSLIRDSWWEDEKRAMVEYKPRGKNKKPRMEEHDLWCYFTEDVLKLTEETKALQSEFREFPTFQVEHIMRENIWLPRTSEGSE